MADMGVMKAETYRFCVAPMMDWSDRHCRFAHRLLSKRARLYSEMVTVPAVIHGKREQLLGFDPREHPVALQLGGSDPAGLAQAAAAAAANVQAAKIPNGMLQAAQTDAGICSVRMSGVSAYSGSRRTEKGRRVFEYELVGGRTDELGFTLCGAPLPCDTCS